MISDQERLEVFWKIATELDAIAQNIAVQTQLPYLYERINIGSSGFCVTAPKSGDDAGLNCAVIFKSAPDIGPGCLKFCPLFEEDFQYLTVNNIFPKISALAMYARPYHTVFFNLKASETMRLYAFLLVHELGHALKSIKNGTAGTPFEAPINERILEEVEMWTSDYKLMLALGGPEYRREFEKGVYWVKKFRQRQCKNPNAQPPNGLDGSSLSIYFGTPPNDELAEIRKNAFHVYCDLGAADQHLPPERAIIAKFEIIKLSAMVLQ